MFNFLDQYVVCSHCLFIQRREREMQQKLEEKDENTLEIKETFSSLQQEVESKTKKLKKVSLHPRDWATQLWAKRLF